MQLKVLVLISKMLTINRNDSHKPLGAIDLERWSLVSNF